MNWPTCARRFSVVLFGAACAIVAAPPTSAFAQELSLDGTWDFAIDTSGSFTAKSVGNSARWRAIDVPSSWQLQFEDLRDYQGVGWYRRHVALPRISPSHALLLQCDAVDYQTEVYLNGVSAGRHEGGYTPFEVDLTPRIKAGDNEILLRVMDPVPGKRGTEGIRYEEIPHGKQSWYVQTSGPWQDLRIIEVPRRRVSLVHVTALLDGSVHCEMSLSGTQPSSTSIEILVLDPSGQPAARRTIRIAGMTSRASCDFTVASPQLWSPERPQLYTLEATVDDNAVYGTRFGFRSFEARDGKLFLNGKPFYMMAALDQGFYPVTGYTAPSEEYLRDEMLKAKRMGLNMLRCHIKVPDPRYLKVADELGLLVWYEIPNWDTLTVAAGKRALATLDEMLKRDWNHPSLVAISLANESWGLDLQKEGQRAWLKSAFDQAKKKATGRLVVDNSACWGNFHMKTDINDYHVYYAIPENRRKFDRAILDLAQRPRWLFSTFGDAEEKGTEPLILSEFGNWGLPDIHTPVPWWIDRKFGDAEVVLPEGYRSRFSAFGYESIFGNTEFLAEQAQRAQANALKYEIEQIRLAQQIQGFVITEFTDVHWESNGLLDMWRRVKVSGQDITTVLQPDVIIPRPQRYNYWSGDEIEVRLWMSRYGDADMSNAQLTWSSSTGERGIISLSRQERATVHELPPVRLPAMRTSVPQSVRITFACTGADGRAIAENYCDVYVFPRPTHDTTKAHLYDPDGRLRLVARELSLMDVPNSAVPSLQSVTISAKLDDEVMRRLGAGETVLCLVDTLTKTPDDFPVAFVRRDTGWYDGNWASSLNWVRRDSMPFSRANFGPVLGFETDALGLPMAIRGIKPENFPDVLAGMFVGWIRLNAAYVMQMRVGRGKLILCTLPLASRCSDDPYAATLLHAMLQWCQRSEMQPKFAWKIH